MFCQRCGLELDDQAVVCPGCGVPTDNFYAAGAPGDGQFSGYTAEGQPIYVFPCSGKSRTAALVLCLLLGTLGIHRFYVGKVGTGILYLLTVGLFGIGWLVDAIFILCGSFTDSAGFPLKQW